MNELIKIIAQLNNQQWAGISKVETNQLDLLEKVYEFKLPEEFKQFYTYSNGGELIIEETVIGFDLIEDIIERRAKDKSVNEHMPGILIWGNDMGSYFYFYDINNKLGKGSSAVFKNSWGELVWESSTYEAENLTLFLKNILTVDSNA